MGIALRHARFNLLRITNMKIAFLAFASAVVLCSTVVHAAQPETNRTGAVYAVVHVDIEPPELQQALPALRAFEVQAKHDPSVVSFDVLEQTGAENHFTLVEVLRSQADYDAFISRAYVRTFRDTVQPFLGGPFDERLHHVMQ
jgi:quinol monooxygenase YgiN